LSYGIKKIQDIYPDLGKLENFPLTAKLVKGNSYGKNIISEYNLALNYKDNLNKDKSKNYPSDIFNREFILKIVKK